MKWSTPLPIEEQVIGRVGVQSCSEAPVIQPSVLIKNSCARSIPVDTRLHSWGSGWRLRGVSKAEQRGTDKRGGEDEGVEARKVRQSNRKKS